MGDGTTKVFVNSKGTEEVGADLKELFAYMNEPHTFKPQKHLTKMIAEQVKRAKQNAEWRQMYMKYQIVLSEAKKEGKIEGLREGMEKGMEKGRLEGLKEACLSMRKKGMDYKEITELINVSVDQVKAWEEEACCLL